MTYIVFDLEWNATFKKKQLPEIIEIGAVKIDLQGNVPQIIDTYHSYVQPVFRHSITKKTRKMTGVTDTELRAAPALPGVLTHFRNWIGPEPYYLCTWGDTDRSVLVENCVQHGLSVNWMRNYNDIQAELMRYLGIPRGNQIGLTRALELMEIEFEGQHHRSIDDAVNTARIFLNIFDRITLRQNICIPREFLFKQHPAPDTFAVYERHQQLYILHNGFKNHILSAYFDKRRRQGWIAPHIVFGAERRTSYRAFEAWSHALDNHFGLLLPT